MEIVRVITFVRFQDKKMFLAAMNLVSIAFGPQIIGSQHLVPMDICCQSVNTTKLSCSLINARFSLTWKSLVIPLIFITDKNLSNLLYYMALMP